MGIISQYMKIYCPNKQDICIYTNVKYGDCPNPRKIKTKGAKKLKEDIRDFIVPIRMSFTEKEKIKARAEKTGKNLSSFIRDSALRSRHKRKAR